MIASIVYWYLILGWFRLLRFSWMIARNPSLLPTQNRLKKALNLIVLTFYYGVNPNTYLLFGLSRVPKKKWLSFVFPQQEHVWHDVYPGKRERNSEYLAAENMLRNKELFHQKCTDANIAVPRTICKLSSGLATKALIERPVFLKPVEGSQMRGCLSLIYNESGKNYRLTGKNWNNQFVDITTEQEILEAIENVLDFQDMLMQPLLVNAASISQIFESSGLLTLRVVSVIQDSKPVMIGAVVEVPSDTVGRWNLFAVDPGTGQLISNSNSELYGRLVEQKLPQWDEITATVIKAHQNFQEIQSIGWDVCLSADGPIIIEGNVKWGITQIQNTYQKGILELLPQSLDR
ncbi:MAG: sugar-transfer associated ATP-grasp domain-containing protein [Parasphingorhabdus sp.]|uniref:sugar-transfer associated ATP-grasp domain-containing protein n=1 Tax=Parasphingorhabdus sp. TaxID=2709688 RepID=UPI0032969CAA